MPLKQLQSKRLGPQEQTQWSGNIPSWHRFVHSSIKEQELGAVYWCPCSFLAYSICTDMLIFVAVQIGQDTLVASKVEGHSA